MLSVQLNSFVHRVVDKQHVLSLVQACGVSLKRIRRSRHWLLSGEEQNLRQLHQQLSADYYWIQLAIEKQLPAPKATPAEVIAQHPGISALALVDMCGCSLSEARQAIDLAEGFE
ncbi:MULTISPECIES: ribosome recycling factor family protein [unclassified Vibrio]|uniref:ribosome recycling factor family protein n=1 Tax=unclassified Vibrio TaxID=2614977 RepID=UPI001361AF0C|nr:MULTISPECIES: ribosome recycling factor family protein [unclassified Vibrio]NAW58699.1 hypothetical protein [Vibrio sp. V36_P2S2PM302]NAX23169.1 hypothetical protein [Vibrio sp. V39_P1S14PM300]NAX26892.1 hypothetical protein [Vibrio sp. V38_P2S17PM301]NAX31747.1 hypothetical protein [Vibrio sp. V37_P2S8PM304]